MGLFDARCPVDSREQTWIEESMSWFRTTFGDEPLRQPVLVPTPEFFPEPLSGTADDILPLVTRMCEYAAVDADTVTTELYGDSAEAEMARAAGLTYRSSSAAGHYRRQGGQVIIGIDQTLVATPARLVATISHELCHVRLDDGVTGDREDHEPLTDLCTVYLGMGIFTANACFEFNQDQWRRSTQRLGYLTEPMFGYGLACYAWLRGERQPTWARHLDANPRAFLKRGLRYLANNTDRLPAG
jgi:hypothetical protein